MLRYAIGFSALAALTGLLAFGLLTNPIMIVVAQIILAISLGLALLCFLAHKYKQTQSFMEDDKVGANGKPSGNVRDASAGRR
jgi:hypothetical protein